MVPNRVAMVVLVVLALLLSLGEGSSLRNELANSLDANEQVDDEPIEDDSDGSDGACPGFPGVFGKGKDGKCKEIAYTVPYKKSTWSCCPGFYCQKFGFYGGAGKHARKWRCRPRATPPPL
jgi:hypothetical protein